MALEQIHQLQDAIVWRDLVDRNKFLAELERANGEPLSTNLMSKLMNSYSKDGTHKSGGGLRRRFIQCSEPLLSRGSPGKAKKVHKGTLRFHGVRLRWQAWTRVCPALPAGFESRSLPALLVSFACTDAVQVSRTS